MSVLHAKGVRIVEYIPNVLNAVSQIGPFHELEDALARAAGAVMTFAENLSRSLATMEPATVAVLGTVSFVVMFVIGYFALLTA